MFASFSRFRRHVAVLTALAMMASVLVAVPAVAADPKADYTATFDACVGDAAGDAGFEDVPASHGNAGDINCIAYYGITKGTSATTYAPLASVTREEMALFLMRLAGKVGIDVNDEPADPGFTDTGDLSEESQMAIAQLADLEIT
ncbi:MAG: S-layer homology domain-containing protein, partial [bacterium]|nr:S-layer homology domain-containing protein [bacterium]